LLFPTIEEVFDLHELAIEEFGGVYGLRDSTCSLALRPVKPRETMSNESLRNE